MDPSQTCYPNYFCFLLEGGASVDPPPVVSPPEDVNELSMGSQVSEKIENRHIMNECPAISSGMKHAK